MNAAALARHAQWMDDPKRREYRISAAGGLFHAWHGGRYLGLVLTITAARRRITDDIATRIGAAA